MKLQLAKLCRNFDGHCVLDKVTLTLSDVNTLVVIVIRAAANPRC